MVEYLDCLLYQHEVVMNTSAPGERTLVGCNQSVQERSQTIRQHFGYEFCETVNQTDGAKVFCFQGFHFLGD